MICETFSASVVVVEYFGSIFQLGCSMGCDWVLLVSSELIEWRKRRGRG